VGLVMGQMRVQLFRCIAGDHADWFSSSTTMTCAIRYAAVITDVSFYPYSLSHIPCSLLPCCIAWPDSTLASA
jgi:hypothetical protein